MQRIALKAQRALSFPLGTYRLRFEHNAVDRPLTEHIMLRRLSSARIAYAAVAASLPPTRNKLRDPIHLLE